jgi:hypothetical protein
MCYFFHISIKHTIKKKKKKLTTSIYVFIIMVFSNKHLSSLQHILTCFKLYRSFKPSCTCIPTALLIGISNHQTVRSSRSRIDTHENTITIYPCVFDICDLIPLFFFFFFTSHAPHTNQKKHVCVY